MSDANLRGSLSINLEKIAVLVNRGIPTLFVIFGLLGYFVSFYFHFLTVTFFLLSVVNFIYLFMQTKHTLLRNFGLIAQLRYLTESIGPEFRQYLFMSDTEEKPFHRIERAEIYRKAKGIDSSSAFGTHMNYSGSEIKLRHSMYPTDKAQFEPYSMKFGEERGISNSFNIKRPVLISAMSYGALGQNAVRALARGARRAGIAMNTGEGGYPKYHLMEGCDLIFQMGTAKFGVRQEDGRLDDSLLEKISRLEQIKMIEIKFSQGAKPGKGGLLPKEKISEEIAELRNVPMGKDVISPPYHIECTNPSETVKFVRRVQEVAQLPVGVKLCLGREEEVYEFFNEMRKQGIFPDYISIDGAEGGTGAAPKSFMDDVGVPIFRALPIVNKMLMDLKIRDRLKLLAAGKLITPSKHFMAFSMGAQAIYTARGFMLALGCIQALQCNKNSCPVGITTHRPELQNGLDIEDKARRIENYVLSMMHEYEELQSAMGVEELSELQPEHILRMGEAE